MDINRILAEKEDKVNFLKGLIRVANADGVQDNSEIVYYNYISTALGLNTEDLAEIDTVWNEDSRGIKLNFTSDEVKMFLFIEAIQLCWLDNSYADAERKEIRAIANELNVSEESIKAVEAWVEEGISWRERGINLLAFK